MFTGLIEETGALHALNKSSRDWQVSVRCGWNMEVVQLGDSVAVNGVCLTVVSKSQTLFTVQISLETVRRSTFQTLTSGSLVNLERALAVGGRLGGHLVQGHVDAVGEVETVRPQGDSLEIWFSVDKTTGGYLVAKGSVAVDGVSLTVNSVRDESGGCSFSVNVIPYSQKKTTLTMLSVGDRVNIETDIIGRYVERLMRRELKSYRDDHKNTDQQMTEVLQKHGFLSGLSV